MDIGSDVGIRSCWRSVSSESTRNIDSSSHEDLPSMCLGLAEGRPQGQECQEYDGGLAQGFKDVTHEPVEVYGFPGKLKAMLL